MAGVFNLLSYNIHKGFDRFGFRFVLNSIRNAIRTVGADVVCLQEVIGEHGDERRQLGDWPNARQFEYLADSVWPHFAYGINAIYSEGHHGNAILSKYPVTGWDNIDISTNPLEDRGLLHARLTVPSQNKTLHILNVHLSLFAKGRRNQYRKIIDRIQHAVNLDEPLVLAGDFNDWGGEATRNLSHLGFLDAHVSVKGTLAKTFPGFFPFLGLDRVYVRNLQVRRAEVLSGNPWAVLSDHCPIVVELAWE